METRNLSIRWHGRGGMGAKTAALFLAEVTIERGGEAQALPEFGPERRGAPVRVYTRLASRRIRERGPIERPDVIVILDPGLLAAADTLAGAGPATVLVVNTPHPVEDVAAQAGVPPAQVVALDASAIARRAIGRDIPNTAVLAAVVAALELMPLDEFLSWLEHRLAEELPEDIVRRNMVAAREAAGEVKGRDTGRALVEST